MTSPEPDSPEGASASAGDESYGDPVASVGQRVFARLIDWMLLFAAWTVIGGLSSERLDDGSLDYSRASVLVWIAVVVVYETAMVARRGQTVGKLIVGIEIVALRDGTTPSWGASFVRVAPVGLAIAVLGLLFPIVMVFVYFSAAFTGDTRGLLDRIAGTVVIRARKPRPFL